MGQEPSENGGQSDWEMGSGEPENDSWLPPDREWVYLPESVVIEDESASYDQGIIFGDTYYYYYFEQDTQSHSDRMQDLRYCRYNLTTKELEKIRLDWDWGEEEEEWVFGGARPCPNSNHIWAYMVRQSRGEMKPTHYMMLYDQNGKCLYFEDRAEWRELGYTPIIVDVDSRGRNYEFLKNKIALWDADGTPAGEIRHDSWEDYIPCSYGVEVEEGKRIVFFRNGLYERTTSGFLYEVDFDKKTVTTLAEGESLKEIKGIGRAPETLAGKTGYYDLVLYDARAVYGYCIADKRKDELFAWKECNMTGKEIEAMGTMPDGRLYAVVDDWTSEDYRIVLFTEVGRDEAPPVTVLTLATVGGVGDDLNASAMRFNRYHFPCRVEVKEYETVNDLYNALLAGEQIDLLDLSRVSLSVLTGHGLLEDLSPYLEKSSSGYHREDFVDGILDAYTVDGILTGIPDSFSIRTVAGDASRYGGDAALTLDAFLTAAEEHPDAKPLDSFGGLTREELMQYLMTFNGEEFVDWESGECSFDSAQFKRVLQCVKNFPEPVRDEYAEISLPTKLQSGEVLYVIADMDSLEAVDLYQAIFGKEDVCVGFPTPDGSGGHLLITEDAFGIMAGSRHKEHAWKFVESVINHRVKYGRADTTNLRLAYAHIWKSYPTLQKTLDDFAADLLARNQETEGEGYGRIEFFGEDWQFEHRHLSREEMNVGPNLVKYAKSYHDAAADAIIRIISEEAPAYYSGQKSLDTVADIIQSRAELYAKENR